MSDNDESSSCSQTEIGGCEKNMGFYEQEIKKYDKNEEKIEIGTIFSVTESQCTIHSDEHAPLVYEAVVVSQNGDMGFLFDSFGISAQPYYAVWFAAPQTRGETVFAIKRSIVEADIK